MTFAPLRSFEFVNYDDGEFVVDNPHVATGLSIENVRWAFTHPYVGAGGPLTWLSHLLDVEIAGLDAGAHHVTNLLAHLATSLVLLLLLTRMTGALAPSAFVAALFAVHPLHVESVAWVTQRKDMLSTLFWLLAISAYVAYVRRPSVWRYLSVFVLTAAGLMSKPTVVALPLTLLLLDYWPLGRITEAAGRRVLWRLVLEKLPLFALAAIAAVLTIVDQRTLGAIAEHVPLSGRLANALVSYVAYLGKTVWPANLAAFYPYRFTISPVTLALCALGLAAITAAAVTLRGRAPYAIAGWLWYLVTLLPAIGIVQAGGHAMADRHTYAPLIGIFIITAWGGREVAGRIGAHRLVAPALALLIVGSCAFVARAQAMHWRDSVSLWQHAASVMPDNDRAHANLGVALAAAGRTREAIEHYRESIRLSPHMAEAHNNLGLALAQAGQADEALFHYREAVRIKPDYANAHNNLASLLASRGQFDEAVRHYREAVRLQPDHGRLRVNLAVALAEVGRLNEAVPHMTEALRTQPDNPQWNYIAGVMLLSAGRRSEAVPYLESAVRLDASNTRARQALDAARRAQ